MHTKNSPGRFDCYSRAKPDEPMFVLLGRDRFAPDLVWLWALVRDIDGESPVVTKEARDCALGMRSYLTTIGREPVNLLACLPFDLLADELRRRGATVHAAPVDPLKGEEDTTG